MQVCKHLAVLLSPELFSITKEKRKRRKVCKGGWAGRERHILKSLEGVSFKL